MTRCSHDVPLEQPCSKCTAEGLARVPAHEHLMKETVVEVEYYPDHEARTESATFRRTKAAGHKAGLRCSISGQPNPEYHHFWCEWADADAVDWTVVKAIAVGEITEIPVLDEITDQPTGETFPAEQSAIWMICQITALRGFDWHAFDPAKPETFIDSPQNMLQLSIKFHRSSTHGIHHRTFPTFVFQGYPRRAGFVFSPDEIVQKEKA
ncbi:hypothetical protein [Paraburkholderia tagetis]